jgi:hypothetical protein
LGKAGRVPGKGSGWSGEGFVEKPPIVRVGG